MGVEPVLQRIALVMLSCAIAAVAPAAAATLSAEQQRFLDAKEALAAGETARYRSLKDALATYPLYPYLTYAELRADLDGADAERIAAFLERYPDTPLAPRLRRAWLRELAAQGRWQEYVAFYRPQPYTEYRCHYAVARVHTGDDPTVWEDIEKLWLVGWSQPSACDPAFAAWEKRGLRTRDKLLARIDKALARNQLRLVGYLRRQLEDSEDRNRVRAWERMARDPAGRLGRLAPDGGEAAGRLFAFGVRRLAEGSPEQAAAVWKGSAGVFAIPEADRLRTERAVAMNLAFQRDPAAVAGLANVADDADARHWRVRAALWQQDWPAVLEALTALPPEERDSAHWRYWRARAHEQLGDTEAAEADYYVASQCRCYYGFLAAERAGRAPILASRPLPVTDWEVARLAEQPAVRRARELEAVGMRLDARREWRDLTARMHPAALRVAAKLAARWQWHDQAILTLGKTDTLDDLELRFPLPFRDTVDAEAGRRGIELPLVYALMRQESAFNHRARSSAGALGLMQLMPATAKRTARRLKQAPPGTYDLLEPERNIRLGTAHLRHLLERYSGDVVFAVAAYNAGERNVERWRPQDSALPADIWIENITYRETRDYVQRVLTYSRIYEWRLGGEPSPMSRHVAVVEADDAGSSRN